MKSTIERLAYSPNSRHARSSARRGRRIDESRVLVPRPQDVLVDHDWALVNRDANAAPISRILVAGTRLKTFTIIEIAGARPNKLLSSLFRASPRYICVLRARPECGSLLIQKLA